MVTAIAQGLEIDVQVADVQGAIETYNTARADIGTTWSTYS